MASEWAEKCAEEIIKEAMPHIAINSVRRRAEVLCADVIDRHADAEMKRMRDAAGPIAKLIRELCPQQEQWWDIRAGDKSARVYSVGVRQFLETFKETK